MTKRKDQSLIQNVPKVQSGTRNITVTILEAAWFYRAAHVNPSQ